MTQEILKRLFDYAPDGHFMAILCVATLAACQNVPIKDEVFYANKGMAGGVSFHTLTTETNEIDFQDWMKLLRTKPLICSSVTTYGDLKAAFEKLCSVCNCCTADTTAAAEEFFNNVQKAAGK